jgi:anti-sigma factor RsiW
MEKVMACESVQELMVDYYYRDLSDDDRKSVAVHLSACASCAMEYCRLEADLSGLGDLLAEGPRPELKKALAVRVQKEFARPWYKRLAEILRSPLPAYQAALLVSAMAALFMLLSVARTAPPAPISASPVFDDVDASTIVSVDPNYL